MNRLTTEDRTKVVRCLADGCSMRATAGIAGVARNTIDKLLVELGAACSNFQDITLRNLTSQRIDVNEIWAFRYFKQKEVAPDLTESSVFVADAWTWVAIDADTKMVPCWTVGKRNPETADAFVSDMASRLADRAQLTSDGLATYMKAIVKAFREDVEYAKLVKYFGNEPEGQNRYSPALSSGCEKIRVIGDPGPKHISTRHIERQNLTMRMGMRCFSRLTNAFSKKIENHAAAISMHMMYYNFARVHQTLRTTPALAARVADHVWSLEEIVALLDSK